MNNIKHCYGDKQYSTAHFCRIVNFCVMQPLHKCFITRYASSSEVNYIYVTTVSLDNKLLCTTYEDIATWQGTDVRRQHYYSAVIVLNIFKYVRLFTKQTIPFCFCCLLKWQFVHLVCYTGNDHISFIRNINFIHLLQSWRFIALYSGWILDNIFITAL